MSNTKKQTIYFYRLTLKCSDKHTSLESLLNLYRKNQINQNEEIYENEKEAWLIEENLNNNVLIFKYEISNFGMRENIKERVTKTNAGVITESQYIEKYQYIVLKKVDEDNYNIVFQNIQSGISYNNFLKFLEKYFKTLSVVNNTTLISGIYYQSDFFTRIANLKTLKKLVIEGKKSNNVELEFAGIRTNDYSLNSKIVITAKKGRLSLLPGKKLENFLKKQYKEYENVKITIKGENQLGDIENILSENIKISEELLIKLTPEKKFNLLDLKDKMISKIEDLENKSYIVLEDKSFSIKNG